MFLVWPCLIRSIFRRFGAKALFLPTEPIFGRGNWVENAAPKLWCEISWKNQPRPWKNSDDIVGSLNLVGRNEIVNCRLAGLLAQHHVIAWYNAHDGWTNGVKLEWLEASFSSVARALRCTISYRSNFGFSYGTIPKKLTQHDAIFEARRNIFLAASVSEAYNPPFWI